MRSSGNQLRLVAVLVAASLVLVGGCAGIAALIQLVQYAGAISTIGAILDDDNGGGDASYNLSGYVYIDREADKIAITDSQLPPDTPGQWETYPGVGVTINTTPPGTTTTYSAATDTPGYFLFEHVTQTSLVLTVEAPEGGLVGFDVDLIAGTITPRELQRSAGSSTDARVAESLPKGTPTAPQG